MFSFSKIKNYPLKKFKFFKSISPFFFNGDLFFSGEKQEKSKTCVYKYDSKRKKIDKCLVPGINQRFISPYIFKYNKLFIMLFENQNTKTKLSKISIAKSNNLKSWKIINMKFIFNKNYSIGSPALIEDKKKDKFLFLFYKTKKNRIKHICFFKKNLNLCVNNYRKNKFIYFKSSYNDYAPFVIKIKDIYYNFFSRWMGKRFKKGFIYFSKSKDLSNWSRPTKVRLNDKIYPNNSKIIHYSEPHVLKKNNKLYLYFEECNEDGIWTIAKTKLLQ